MAVLTLLVLVSLAAFAADPPEIGPVIVTGTRLGASRDALERDVTVIGRSEIERAPGSSLPSILANCSGADSAVRAPLGVQADIGLRGGTFQQTLMMVDGIRVNDPQTGHHNTDLPLTSWDLERIEVLKGAGSSAHGPDAFGGAVNLITRAPDTTGLKASASGGGFNTKSAAAAGSLARGDAGQALSVEAAQSDGFAPDRDFRTLTLSSRTESRGSLGLSRLNLGYNERAFGARDFYSPGANMPSREWTRTLLCTAAQAFHAGEIGVEARGSVRQHDDTFILDRTRPDYYRNETATRSWVGNLQASGRPSPWLALLAGGESAGDGIDSTKSGEHQASRHAFFGETRLGNSGPLSLGAGIRYDRTGFGDAWSPSSGVSLRVAPWARIRTAVGRSFRIPTFTELYYHDDYNDGDAGLRPEEAVTCEAGADVIPLPNASVSLTAFNRDQSRTIDWARSGPKSPWIARNLGRIRFTGLDGSLAARVGAADVSGGFAWTKADKSGEWVSKYALNHPRVAWRAGIHLPLFLALALDSSLLWREKESGDRAAIMDMRISRKFGNTGLFVDGFNMFNKRYEEVIGVEQSGRWFSAGLSISLP